MSAPLRWLVLATHVPASGSGGGMVRYCVELIRALREQPGVDVAVLGTPETRPFFADLVGADAVHDLPGLPVAVRSVVERAGPAALPVLRKGWDVVHGAKHLVPRSTPGATRLLTVHDMNPLDRPADFGTLKRVGLRRPYLASVAQAEALVCVSEATRTRLTAWSPADGRRAGVVHLAAAPGLVEATSTPVEALVGRRFAVVVGDSSPRKNRALTYRFWPEVVRALPDAVLAVVGPPSWGPSQQAAAGLVRDGHVVELGHRTDGELRWLYEHAAVVLCPSQLEGFGLPVVEGAAFGATVLLSDDPAMGEVGPPDAVRLSLHLPSAWARVVVRVMDRPRRPAAVHAARRWSDVAAGTVQEVRRARER